MTPKLLTQLVVALSVSALVLIAAGDVRAADDEGRFLEGLRERRLFTLAEKYLTERLADSQLAPAERTALLVELSQTRVDAALNTPPEQRAERWSSALRVLSDAIAAQPSDARRLLLDVQSGLVHLSHGCQARQEAELVADSGPRLDEARAELRLAIEQLRTTSVETARLLRDVQLHSPTNDAPWTTDELLSLDKNVRYQLARALREQGESYPRGSADRVAAIDQTVELLGPLAQLDTIDPLAWRARLDEIICWRLLDDTTAAQRRLDLLLEQQPPPAIELAARAERLRLLLAEQRLDQAVGLIAADRTIAGQTSAELDLATLEVLIAAARAATEAKQPDEAQHRQQQAVQLLAMIDATHGPYWSRRADMLVAGNVQTTAASADLTLLVRSAEGFYRAGEVDEALRAYDQVQQVAASAGHPEQGFDAAYTAAAIEQQRGRHDAAAQRFAQLARAQPTHARAADAHLLAAYNAAQALDPQNPQAVEGYRTLLVEHLQMFPSAATSEQARLWLGRLEQAAGRWDQAASAYRAIAPASPHFGEALQGLAACDQHRLAALAATGVDPSEQAAEAARFFESTIGSGGVLPQHWSAQERTAGLEAARLWLDFTARNEARAERILSAALAGSGDAPEAWQLEARALMVVALASQGRTDEAAAMLDTLRTLDATSAVELVERLAQLADRADSPLRESLAKLALEATGRLLPTTVSLPAADQQRLARAQATALRNAGQLDEARRRYQQLARDYPKDAAIQQQYAELLSASEDRPTLEAALEQWRTVERHAKPASDLWFQAKYALAGLHMRLGHPERALEIIDVTAVLHPELGGPELRSKFLALRERATSK